MNDKIYDNLRRRMEAHTQSPPVGLWDGIERAMNRREAFRARRRRWFYAVGSVAAVAVGALLLLLDGGFMNEDSSVEHLAPVVASEYHRETPTPTPDVVETTPPELRSTEALRRDDVAAAVIPTERTPDQPRPTTEGKAGRATENNLLEEKPFQTENPPREDRPSSAVNTPPRDNFSSAFEDAPARSKRRKWQAGLYAANLAPNGSSSTLHNADISSAPSSPVYSLMTPPMTKTLTQSLNTFASTPEPSYDDDSHSLPLTVGLSVSYGVGGRWSLSSGATWTRLSSRAQGSRGSVNGSRKRTLHYIGIPLDVRYDIWSGGALSLYVSAGGQFEKSVSGTEIHTLSSGTGENLTRKRSLADRPQWSARGSAGLQWDFTRAAGIYLEPGVNYYFDNGSTLETLYKAKPLNFGLRVGLRFSL